MNKNDNKLKIQSVKFYELPRRLHVFFTNHSITFHKKFTFIENITAGYCV